MQRSRGAGPVRRVVAPGSRKGSAPGPPPSRPRPMSDDAPPPAMPRTVRAPEFPAGLDWLNTGGRPLALADLRGRLALVEVWTYG